MRFGFLCLMGLGWVGLGWIGLGGEGKINKQHK